MTKLIHHPWSVEAVGWQEEEQKQYEALFCQGNGAIGMRCAAEWETMGRQEGLFAAGVFDKPMGDVSELVNLPACFSVGLCINEKTVVLADAQSYQCTLCLQTGLVTRRFTLQNKLGQSVHCTARRLVSLANQHLCAMELTLEAQQACSLTLTPLLNGQATNSGTQHVRINERRCIQAQELWRLEGITLESQIPVALCTAAALEDSQAQTEIAMERAAIGLKYGMQALPGEKITLTQYVGIATGRDSQECSLCAQATAENARKQGFEKIASESAAAWQEYWTLHDVCVDSENPMDQTALRFALYHLRVMTPVSDERMNIGAKGLSGEAYKGHTFWDTEMFLFCPWLYTQPQVARNLLKYRYFTLPKAREKAKQNGCGGALFPWESAWIDDGEMTPDEGEPDVQTGKPIAIQTGKSEIHINADVAFGICRYYEATGDLDFMERYGDEMLLETALYWATRAQWNEEAKRFEVLHVIGPDEYSEDSNNNAYTNHLAYWNLCQALVAAQRRREKNLPALISKEELAQISHAVKHWYLPEVDANGLIPQADGWLALPCIDLAPYKGNVGAILKRYNMKQLEGLQVSKQADVVALLSLFPDAYALPVAAANFDYYEAHCVHDSSLSYNTHSLVAAQLGNSEEAYRLFEKAMTVDLREGCSAQAGIHAAAMGGLWQCAVMGFGGMHIQNGELRVEPCLPKAWKSLEFTFAFQNLLYKVSVTEAGAKVTQVSGGERA
ncbi:MAG: glycosyl hydrolase family 65 protein [Clostridia bacterium]